MPKVSTAKETTIEKALTSPEEKVDRFKLSEMAYSGLNLFNGVTTDEIKKELNFPDSVRTFKMMSYHSTINAALTLYDALISKADWKVTPPANATPQELEQTERIREMMHDMDHSWIDFIRDALSANVYGFSVHEKVYRKRYKANGSMYDDGVIGWKKLPIRSQESIIKFIFSDDGNEIKGVTQSLAKVNNVYGRYEARAEKEINIPKSKMLLFRVGRHRGDPYGKSPLRDAYLAWRYLTALEEIEANGVSKDLSGIPVLKLPPQYLAADASPEMKSIRLYYENAMRNMQVNQQSSIILPQAFDPDTRQPLFSLELLSQASSGKNFDTIKIKEYYKNLILTSLFADLLTMGQSATGSYALGSIKSSLIGVAIEAIVKSISEEINQNLVRQTYELNGWNPARRCSIDYDNLETPDLEAFSKAIQRYSSVSMMTKDLDTINKIRETIGLDPLTEDDDFESLLTDNTSRSGDGYQVGKVGNGTSNSVSGTDNSSLNLDNSA